MMKTLALAVTVVGVAILTVYIPAYTPDYSQFNQPLTKDQEILHALDRLTFGPRPGDVEAVKKLGLKKWIDQQLHPERIAENPEVAAHLAPLDSLSMSRSQMVQKYPSAQVVQAMMSGKMAMSMDPDTRAAVELQEKRRQAKQDAKAGTPPDGDQATALENLQKLLTREQIQTLRNGTPEARAALLQSLTPETRDQVLATLPGGIRQQLMATADPATRRKVMTVSTPQQVVPSDLTEGKLYRAIYSNRQLEEQMVDFWYNHFNVYLDKGADKILTTSYEREAIRPHVFGKFRELLEATATSPAMLFYLDNWESVSPDRAQQTPARQFGKQRARQFAQAKQAKGKQARGLNENYARELMELHTLGVDGGYTQQDIIEVARCFTGWTIAQPNLGGDFSYNDRVHDKGEKIVLGVKIPAGGGRDDAEKVLDILARHPNTARFISTKLAKKFVADDPPPALIDRMAKTFHDSDGDIRAVMSTMLESKEFFSAGAFRAKVKTPLEMIVSAVRATGADVNYAMPLGNQIAELGQPLYRKVEPTGYSSANTEWVNSAALLARMNFALALAGNKVPGVTVDIGQYRADPADTARQILFSDASQQTIASINKAIMQKEPTPALVAGLVIGSPDFQRR